MILNKIVNGAQRLIFQEVNKYRGWTTNRKIVVIESDDWGSIRMPSFDAYNKMILSGVRVDKSHYNKFDTLATNLDFDGLFGVLAKYKDRNGINPVFTCNTIVANPDFEKIKLQNFDKYFYEPLTETIKNYENCDFKKWTEGISNKFIFPQFHGREHLNVSRWMHYLKEEDEETHLAFRERLFGIGPKISMHGNPSFLQAYEIDKYTDVDDMIKSVEEGLLLFEKIFGYKSRSFIAPNYVWPKFLESTLAGMGVKFIQGEIVQRENANKRIYNYLGKVNNLNQIYLVRNVMFEPSSNYHRDWVSNALIQIDKAFKTHQPATICSHRVNFVGGIFQENRDFGLQQLDSLLNNILKRWPDVEFMTSVELGSIISENY